MASNSNRRWIAIATGLGLIGVIATAYTLGPRRYAEWQEARIARRAVASTLADPESARFFNVHSAPELGLSCGKVSARMANGNPSQASLFLVQKGRAFVQEEADEDPSRFTDDSGDEKTFKRAFARLVNEISTQAVRGKVCGRTPESVNGTYAVSLLRTCESALALVRSCDPIKAERFGSLCRDVLYRAPCGQQANGSFGVIVAADGTWDAFSTPPAVLREVISFPDKCSAAIRFKGSVGYVHRSCWKPSR